MIQSKFDFNDMPEKNKKVYLSNTEQ